MLDIFVHLSAISVDGWGEAIGHHFLFLFLFLSQQLKFLNYFFQPQIISVHEEYLNEYFSFFCDIEKFPFLI